MTSWFFFFYLCFLFLFFNSIVFSIGTSTLEYCLGNWAEDRLIPQGIVPITVLSVLPSLEGTERSPQVPFPVVSLLISWDLLLPYQCLTGQQKKTANPARCNIWLSTEDTVSFLIHKTELIKPVPFLIIGVHFELTDSYFKNTLGFIKKGLAYTHAIMIISGLIYYWNHTCLAINNSTAFFVQSWLSHWPLHCWAVGNVFWGCHTMLQAIS